MKAAASIVLAMLVAACSGPILANPTLKPGVVPTPRPVASAPADPQPVVFPRDAAPHDRLTEWWYYTGHLVAEDSRRFGFEVVIFRAERGDVPVTWASHLALTEESSGTFRSGQRAFIGPAVDHSPRDPAGVPNGFTLIMPAVDPATGIPVEGEPWQLSGAGDHHVINAQAAESVASGPGGAVAGSGFGLDLDLVAERQPALHAGIGWIDFDPAGSSYYYSITRLATVGTLTIGDETMRVSGSSWFDHQWGDFVSVGGGGWDWFAVNLEDGTDLTLSLVRAADGTYPLIYGTLVEPGGTVRNLDRDAFTTTPTGTWTSPTTGVVYPAGWTVELPGEGLVIDLEPTVANQELDTRATTGVIYWEGSQVVQARRDGVRLGGEAYVELTGYMPAQP
ncbi:MAG: lipocalin family protein [Candidatus Limnocylindrales bacterium]